MAARLNILSLDVDCLSFREGLKDVMTWGLQRQKGFICFANVHMTIEAYHDPQFAKDLQKARLVLPDGKPVAVACKWLHRVKQERIAGMDFMPALLEEADKTQAKIFLYGSTEEVLRKLVEQIKTRFPRVNLAGSISPPFRKLKDEEAADHIKTINDSGAQFVLVALGCPKQEKWMAAHFQAIDAILLGLGGAFPVVAGVQKRCPKWMRNAGLEWLFRLYQEPRRLMKRYLVTNSLFIRLLMRQLFSSQKST